MTSGIGGTGNRTELTESVRNDPTESRQDETFELSGRTARDPRASGETSTDTYN